MRCENKVRLRIDNYLRITVGTQAEMERLVEVLAELVK